MRGTPPRAVLEAALQGRIVPVGSWNLADELARVLRRPKIRAYDVDEVDVTEILTLLAGTLPAVDVQVEIRDPADAPVVEAAVAGRAEVIVTGDRDLLDDAGLVAWLEERGVEVMTPAQLIERLG
jgi:putative PIN family toxin of toxin-antitoxin system